jgi:type IV secretory pathway VirB2 component (pilin)
MLSLVGRAAQITCQMLALEAGAGLPAWAVAAFVAAVTCLVTSHGSTGAQGAGGHCQSPGQRLVPVVRGRLQTTLAGILR